MDFCTIDYDNFKVLNNLIPVAWKGMRYNEIGKSVQPFILFACDYLYFTKKEDISLERIHANDDIFTFFDMLLSAWRRARINCWMSWITLNE